MEKKSHLGKGLKSSFWTGLTTRLAGCFMACIVLIGCGGGNDGLSNSLDDRTNDNETAADISDNYEYVLPVVFHVLYKDQNDELQNPSKAHLDLIIDSVNALYRRNHMNITFEMATKDENEKELNEAGIMRHAVDFDDYDEDSFLRQSSIYGTYTQNLKKFINIYVFRFKKGSQNNNNNEVMGITSYPFTTKEHPLAGLSDTTETFLSRVRKFSNPWGICINNKFINEYQEYSKMNIYCIWNTLAHELGHYLGLFHTFSYNGCDDTDYCDDTRNCNYTLYKEDVAYFLQWHKTNNFYELPKRVDCNTGDEYYADNIMDYMFSLNSTLTAQQRKRTRHVLNYSPLVPGPKIATTRASIDIPAPPTYCSPHLSDCPSISKSK